VADDGVYERDVEVPAGKVVTEAAVRGSFTDEVGNQATLVEASRTLSVREAPDPISLLSLNLAQPPDPPTVTIRWTQSLEPDFAAYRVFRSDSQDVETSDHLVGSIASPTTLETEDTEVIEGKTYSYRVFVRTNSGLESGSNTVQSTITNLRPPVAVVLDPPDASSFTRVALKWSKSPDRDFQVYRVFRNDSGAVTDSDSLIASIIDIERTYLDDLGLRENTAHHYRVYVFDRGGLFSRSNEVMARTRNEPPPAIVLDPASLVDSTDVALSWSMSTIHDFAFYNLYRDKTATVSTASTLVVEIDDPSVTTFLDTDLDPATQYYYRVFVVDNGEDPGPESTGSNTVSLSTSFTLSPGGP
jgi:fibronectin type 3 domain-containing protein